MQNIIAYILTDYSLGAQRNMCWRNSIWMAERESESAVPDVRIQLQVWDLFKVASLVLPAKVQQKLKTIKTDR